MGSPLKWRDGLRTQAIWRTSRAHLQVAFIIQHRRAEDYVILAFIATVFCLAFRCLYKSKSRIRTQRTKHRASQSRADHECRALRTWTRERAASACRVRAPFFVRFSRRTQRARRCL